MMGETIVINKSARRNLQKELVDKTVDKLIRLAASGFRRHVVPPREYIDIFDKSWEFAQEVKVATNNTVSYKYGSSTVGVEFYIEG